MAKIKQDRELLKIIDDYKTFINAEKRINAPIIVSEPKGNHGTSHFLKALALGYAQELKMTRNLLV